ncbi:hypothetical protein DPPLL_30550 [Desulfofustis limnaeus]|uniref:Rieske domain-containing protein n=2 Tax=Desulfofustis limnaeus TaxID=2740163 RepID=A0ABN6M8N8_9BACT|nr:hypothetical protein DPPLL_30550 [Desulfofustis limnaeus]
MERMLKVGLVVVGVLFGVVCSLLWAADGWAAQYEVSFSYAADPEAPPAGFALYRLAGDERVTVVADIGPDQRSFFVELPDPDPLRCDSYFMAALFGADGVNGPYSRAYPLCPAYDLPAGSEVRISGTAVIDLVFRRVDVPGGE